MVGKNGLIIDEIIRLFNEYYPNIIVKHVNQGDYDSLIAQVANAITAGNQPTLVQSYKDQVAFSIMGDAVSSLDKYIYNPIYGITQEHLNDYVQRFIKECQAFNDEGTTYSLSFNKSTEVLYFNATWFVRKI